MSGENIEGAPNADLCPICGHLKAKYRTPVCLYCAGEDIGMVRALVIAEVMAMFAWLARIASHELWDAKITCYTCKERRFIGG